MKEYLLQYASTDRNKKSHYKASWQIRVNLSSKLLLYVNKCKMNQFMLIRSPD